MGISFSCPFSDSDDLDNGFETVTVRSISFGGGELRTELRSVSFNGRDSEPTIMKSLGSGKLMIEGSVSFKRGEMETMISIKAPSSDKEKNGFVRSVSTKSGETNTQLLRSDSSTDEIPQLSLSDSGNPKHQAALKLQKVYKSFRTRRKLADCAVLVEQQWWEVLDFVELERNSISFFNIGEPETAFKLWSRAKFRVAKVGKGLLKDENAQKLALQHWLEAIDPRHRYGHNLHFYYDNWFNCKSKQPFFYWLDIGEGKKVNLVDKCPRSKLKRQCIKYLGPAERRAYEVMVENGKFLYKLTGKRLDTTGGPKDAKWIFVLSTSKTLYVGQKCKGTFQHSSFLAGGATSAAGRLVVEDGILKAVWRHSGHYRPTEENFQELMSFLKEHNVDLTDVKENPMDEEEEPLIKHRNTICLRRNSSEQDLSRKLTGLETEDNNAKDSTPEKTDTIKQDNGAADYMVPKRNLFDEDQEENDEEIVPKESILRRIDSHRGMKSYQLGQQLSCKWTTGAGPRIGCVRDYPSELQFRALEEVNLSPRSAGYSRALSSPRNTTGLNPKVSEPTSLCREATTKGLAASEHMKMPQRSAGLSRTHSAPLNRAGLSQKPSTPTALWREIKATTMINLK